MVSYAETTPRLAPSLLNEVKTSKRESLKRMEPIKPINSETSDEVTPLPIPPTKRPSLSTAVRKMSIVTPKCGICEKSVYKMEEMIAIGKVFHKACFTCSGNVKDGCGRTLNLHKYLEHNETAYCEACYTKLFKPKGHGYGGTLNGPSGEATEETSRSSFTGRPSFTGRTSFTAPVRSTSPARTISPSRSFVAPTAPACTRCAKSVYKMEEMLAVNRVWHKACFTCGGSADDGCNRTLNLDKYLEHENNPYCEACYAALFKPKGFGAGLEGQSGGGK